MKNNFLRSDIMCKFALGLTLGTLVGAGMILSVNPMSKRDFHRACNRAERMMSRMGHTLRDWT